MYFVWVPWLVFFGLWFVCFAVMSVYTGMYVGDSRTNPREGGGGVTPSPATVPASILGASLSPTGQLWRRDSD
jgi:hypothetical protein